MANNSKLIRTVGTLAAVSFSLGAFADVSAGDVFEVEELNAGFMMADQTNFSEEGSCGEASCGEESRSEEDDKGDGKKDGKRDGEKDHKRDGEKDHKRDGEKDDKDEEGTCGEGACGES